MITPNFIAEKKPLFPEKVFVTRPSLPSMEELTPMLEGMLKRRWVTNFGAYHQELEEKIRRMLGVKHVLLCCNGTVGLFLLLNALELKGGVVTTPFTFPATIHAVYMAGLKPVFCDIEPDTYTLDPASVKKAITPSVGAILPVNVFGNVADIESLQRIASQANIPLIFDSAHAFLTHYHKKAVGGFGKAEMFSFHATKLFTTLEGGAITTNDTALYKKLRLLINFGIKDEEHVVSPGLNGKMTEVNAIFGLLSCKKIHTVIRKLTVLSAFYKEKLAAIPGIKFQQIRKGCVTNAQYLPVEIVEEEFGLSRDMLHAVLKADNVFARKYFFPAGHRYECYAGYDFSRKAKLPNTDRVSRRILCLPMYPSLSAEDAGKICALIAAIQKDSAAIRKKYTRRIS